LATRRQVLAKESSEGRRWFPRFYYGWWIVAGAFMMQALGNALYMNSFGAYFVHLQEEFGWSRTLISGAYSLTRLETGFLSPFQGWLITRLGPRLVLQVGLAVFCIGLLFLAVVDSVPGYYVALLVIATGTLRSW
jgi:MFS family permease